jgi:hypothetical protein
MWYGSKTACGKSRLGVRFDGPAALREDTPADLFDFARWDCVGGDILVRAGRDSFPTYTLPQ